MPRIIDDELVARAVAWCREAARQATPEEVRAALGTLGWDELLAARAVLADPPPTHPLGPLALADIARGASAALAAERERAGQYQAEPSPARRGAGAGAKKKRGGGGGPVIRRFRDRREPARPEPAGLPPIDELLASEGRTILERLVRENGARRGQILAALAAGWRRPDGSPPGEEDLTRLLDTHGLARGFERRERDELLYALRAAAGSKTRASAALGLTPAAFDAALEHLGGGRQAESIQAAHREELRRRATLSERVRLLVGEAELLGELGLLAEVEDDVRKRLPEHVRALRASGAAPLSEALARSLTVAPRDVTELAARLTLELDPRGLSGPSGLAEVPRNPPARAPGAMRRPGPNLGRPAASRTTGDRSKTTRGPPFPGRRQDSDRASPGGARRRPPDGSAGARDAGARGAGARGAGARGAGARGAGARGAGARGAGARGGTAPRPSTSKPKGAGLARGARRGPAPRRP